MTNFFLSHFNLITLIVWVVFFAVVIARVVRPRLVKNISYSWLIAIAVSLRLLWGIFATWGQYTIWKGIEMGKVFIASPFPEASPLAPLPEFFRPLFAHAHGYFAFFAFERFFLSSLALFLLTAVFVVFFKLYSKEHPVNFGEDDIAVIALAFLISGWSGSIVLVPLSLICAIVLVLIKLSMKSKSKRVNIATAFLVATPFALVFAVPLLTFVHLWPTLKL
jgi:hypothetical protein